MHEWEEQREEDEEFYESLDWILSSTSCSDDDSNHQRCLPRFPPPAATSYDAWTIPLTPIEERRRLLLIHFGINPPFCSRSDSVHSVDVVEQISRSVARSISHFGPSKLNNSVDICKDSQNIALDVDAERKCTIKNLDNGEEFVVKEGGMWGRLRELTMEEFEMCVGKSPIVLELMRRQCVESAGKSNDICGQNSNFRAVGKAKKFRKRGWLKSIKSIASNEVAGGYYRERWSSEEKDYSSSDRGGRRSSSATDDS